MKIDVSIIVVGYKSENTILPFLDSLKPNQKDLSLEVILVNNFPQDGTVNLAKNHPLKLKIIENKENIGFSKAVNMGLKIAVGDYVYIANPDTRLIGKSLKKLVEFAKSAAQVGAVAPRLLNNNGTIQPSCFRFPTILNAIKQNFLGVKNAYKKYNPGNNTTKVDVAVMASFLVPRNVFKQVGGLDERFFLYYEDVEFCERLAKNNLYVYYFPKAKSKHDHGASGNFISHLQSPLLNAAKTYYGPFYFSVLNLILWLGHKWQVILRGKKFKD